MRHPRLSLIAAVCLLGFLAVFPASAPAQDSPQEAPLEAHPAPLVAQPSLPRLPHNPRALWVVRDALVSRESIERMVRDAARAGITDLLVQVRGRGDAYYLSSLEPLAPEVAQARETDPDFDPLALVITLGHRRGIRVHAWLNVYLVGGKRLAGPEHILLRHPEWSARNPRGETMFDLGFDRMVASGSEGIYLEPGTMGVVREFDGVVADLLDRYPVDGIHLDYVRYPDLDVGYSDAMRAGFRRLTGVDPLELAFNRRGLEAERGEAGVLALDEAWRKFKADQVTALVRSVRAEMRRRRPDALLSAAVKADPQAAFVRNGQEWDRWLREGWIDVAVPMMYSRSGKIVREQAEEAARLVPPERVWGGIAVYNQSLDAAAAKLASVERAGLGGTAIFSYNSIPGGGGSLARLFAMR